MSIYRLYGDEDGVTHLEPWTMDGLRFESGPGVFKGIGGSILGAASRVMLMRLEGGSEPPLHRANPGLAILLEGAIEVRVADGGTASLLPGDAVRIESTGTRAGGWSPANTGEHTAVLAIVQMPAAESASSASETVED